MAIRRLVSAVVLILVLLSIAGCAGNPSEVTADLGQGVSLSLGQSVVIPSEKLQIKFSEVINDSRCPNGVICIWAGEVSCLVEITHAEAVYPVVLTQPGLTGDPAQKTFQEYQLTFRVEPYPESGGPIPPENYRLRLTVSQLP